MGTPATINQLKIRRRTLKGSLTRFETYLNELTDETFDIDSIKLHKSRVVDGINEFIDIQENIEMLDESETDSNAIGEYESQYLKLIGKANLLIKNNCIGKKSTSSNASAVLSETELPKIQIPKFSGEFDKWLPFYNAFKSMIHERENITSTQKYHHLISCLEGEAAELIASSEICPSSYDEAWNALIKAFNNRRKLIYNHVSAIFDWPCLIKESSVELLRLIRGFAKHIRALKVLELPTNYWDTLIVFLIRSKLDLITRREWDRSLSKDELPTFEQIFDFIEEKCSSWDYNDSDSHTEIKKQPNLNPTPCSYCKGPHFIVKCNDFKQLSINDRHNFIKSANLCTKCLKKANHSINKCFGSNCGECKKPHHILIHREVLEKPTTSKVNFTQESSVCQALLTTAVVNVQTKSNSFLDGRVLLDNGAQSNFITRDFANKIGAKLDQVSIKLECINNIQTSVQAKTNILIKSRVNSYSINLNCYVVDKITGLIPELPFNTNCLNLPKNIELADPKFNIPAPVNILIASPIFWKILCDEHLDRPMNVPSVRNTLFGWVIGGGFVQPSTNVKCNLSTHVNTEFNLEKFWEIESLPGDNKLEEVVKKEKNHDIELYFKNTVKRDDNGRFTVKMPFVIPQKKLGSTKQIALKRFYNLERKFSKEPEFKGHYVNFMREYESLNHMELVPKPDDRVDHCYIPHHGVVKNDSVTTKLRVVFDASMKSGNGLSLNNILLTGPTLQEDLINITLRFRLFKYILCADITKMYRQILIDPSQRSFQRIVWRENESEPIKVYQLNTLTYGTAPASYLAVKCLLHLANEYKSEYPEASEILKHDFYMEYLITGFHDKLTAIKVRDDIISLLNKGQFKLNKFNSNNAKLLTNLDQINSDPIILLNKMDNNKILGLKWDTQRDMLLYLIPEINNKICTKRTIVSDTAKLFHPLGLINPIVVTAKIIIQQLWILKIDWDSFVPNEIKMKWNVFSNSLSYLSQLAIQRCIIYTQFPYLVEIHAFSDASQRAYGSCVYLRVQNFKGDKFETQLLCAKSRIAPIKQQTIPRLELCAALLTSKLVDKEKSSLNIKIHKFFYYTDSMIVLAWIKKLNDQWKIFVASRVAMIRDLTSPDDWYYVNTTENPADIISRGSDGHKLINNSLWWNGPAFLKSEIINFEKPPEIANELIPDKKKTTVILNTKLNTFNIFEKYSSLTKLKRVVAYCLRFNYNCKNKNNKKCGVLSTSELNNSTMVLLKLVQNDAFQIELNYLATGKQIPKESEILSLNPFLDDNGLIRVGGRLKNAPIEYNKKYQVLLPASHAFSYLVYNYTHMNNMHSGVQTTLAAIRQKYWPIAAKNCIKKVIRRCIICFKNRPTSINPLMGNLPIDRVTIAKPFTNCGVDYCGPFLIKEGQRKIKTTKAYIAVFICFFSKAVHLEIVSNLTTDAFIAAMRRFISRRGRALNVYSDNGTNFVGANRELRELYTHIQSTYHQSELINAFAHEGLSWHFNPPRSPHFGGLWEAAVKNVKFHLKRVTGESKLTFEEMYTLVTQIEAILNSRPLTPMSNDPNDYSFLTPGHFLIGQAITSLPCDELNHINMNRLSRWQHVQQMHQHFWHRWSKEYLCQLQIRTKWKRVQERQHIGDLVLIRDDNQPPAKWVTGRISQLHPGSDGVIRAVSIRTPDGGTTRRATARVCRLPMDNPNEKDAAPQVGNT